LRRIIFNADDFGLTPGVNRAILEASAAGVLKSATLMANGAAFAQASASALTSKLSIGCHLVFIDGKPVSPPAQVPTLLSGKNAQFYRTLAPFILRAVTRQFSPPELEAEATAQIRKLQAAGIPVSHVDTHKHTHLLPQILHPVLRAAQATGVRAIRNPFEPLRLSAFGGRPRLWKRYLQLLLLSARAANFRRAVAQAGMVTPDGTLAIAATGSLDRHLFRQILHHLPDGTWEFVCHPGYNDAELQRAGTRLLASRQHELALLTSPETRQLIENQNIELISYCDLASQPSR
jgi:predicted glycoside hydrolase/deacetylase ChbG (UPF0249 family)